MVNADCLGHRLSTVVTITLNMATLLHWFVALSSSTLTDKILLLSIWFLSLGSGVVCRHQMSGIDIEFMEDQYARSLLDNYRRDGYDQILSLAWFFDPELYCKRWHKNGYGLLMATL